MGDMAIKLLPVACIFLVVLVLLSGGCSKNEPDSGPGPAQTTVSHSQAGGPLAYVPQDLIMKADEESSIQMEATGGQPPYSWKVKAGSLLPSGFRLTSKGLLTGNPSITGDADQITSAPFTVIIRDSTGATTEVELTITFVR